MLDLGLGSPAAGAEEAQVSAPSGLVARRPSWTKRLLELGEELSLDLSTPAKSSRALRLGRGTAEEWATPCAAPGTPTGSRSRSQSCHRTPQRSLSCRSSCSPQKAPWRSPRCRGGGGPLSARRRAPPAIQTQTPTPKLARARRASAWGLRIATPSSSPPASPRGAEGCGTPQPQRSDFRVLAPDADVGAVLFDFDGTLTSVPGMASRRTRRQLDLRQRAPLLEPRLRALRDAGLSLGIISKSSEATIRTSLVEAGLCEFFDGPLVANAVGFDGKAGFIEELVQGGSLRHLGPSGLRRVLLVDDDVQELEHARARGVQALRRAAIQIRLAPLPFSPLIPLCLPLFVPSFLFPLSSVIHLPLPPPLPPLPPFPRN
ncbi:unnamed protein product [Prorocentrum cordatum]|uniref:Trehalose-phosphatase n=1 Tax=Prorocentrum cordatum TaxID=2364126 RepID=A0ABN9W1P3_9DINO|nr:unnamed protein product [Polarella glacialis]